MTGAVSMCVDGVEFKISPVYSMGFGQTGYVAYQLAGGLRTRTRSYAKDNVRFFGRNGFDESRALNYIAEDYARYIKELGASYNND